MSYSLHFTGHGETQNVKEITANFDLTAQAIVLIVLLRGQDYLAQIFISLHLSQRDPRLPRYRLNSILMANRG